VYNSCTSETSWIKLLCRIHCMLLMCSYTNVRDQAVLYLIIAMESTKNKKWKVRKIKCAYIALPSAPVIIGLKIIGVHLKSEDKNIRT